MKINRLMKIEQYIIANQTVTLDKLCEVFGISKNTVRRDISDLVKSGTVKKVYGGVTAVKKALVPFEERDIKNKAEKLAIAQLAAEDVQDGDIIYVDSGTTAPNIIKYLKGKDVTIVTESLNVILNALPFPELKIILLGGNFIREANSFRTMNIETIMAFNINKAFMATTGLSIGNGITNSSPLEYEIKREIVGKCDKIYLLADHSKFGVSSLMTYCKLEDIDCLITDQTPPSEFLTFFNSNRIECRTASLSD